MTAILAVDDTLFFAVSKGASLVRILRPVFTHFGSLPTINDNKPWMTYTPVFRLNSGKDAKMQSDEDTECRGLGTSVLNGNGILVSFEVDIYLQTTHRRRRS